MLVILEEAKNISNDIIWNKREVRLRRLTSEDADETKMLQKYIFFAHVPTPNILRKPLLNRDFIRFRMRG